MAGPRHLRRPSEVAQPFPAPLRMDMAPLRGGHPGGHFRTAPTAALSRGPVQRLGQLRSLGGGS
jgi:hypothetical protein